MTALRINVRRYRRLGVLLLATACAALPSPAHAETALTSDGSWKLEFNAFASDVGIYKAVGTAARTFHLESRRRFPWEAPRRTWVERPVELITIHNEFWTAWGWPVGALAGTMAWKEDASFAEAKYWRLGQAPADQHEPARVLGRATALVSGEWLRLTAQAP